MNIELTPNTLLAAYCQGLFPMADEDGEISWFSPDPRAILPLDAFHVPDTLRRRYNQGPFELRVDGDFEGVMRGCADRSEGTWIDETLIRAYGRLHRLGFAHSVESWRDGELVGGLYGVTIGGAFFGESMFYRATDASKIALVYLIERMRQRGFTLLDVQFPTQHTLRFGAVEIPRREYMRRLHRALRLDRRFVD